jgi:branched-chain amino acid transport system permease protein
MSGAIIAAILLTLISTTLQSYADTRMIIYSLVLILTMIYRPQGLMGTREITSFFKKSKKQEGGHSDGTGQTVA